jgi:hypothetical protein
MRKMPCNAIHNFSARCNENNTVYMVEYMRIYNEEKIVCECGKTVCRGAFLRHLRSKYHAKRTTCAPNEFGLL